MCGIAGHYHQGNKPQFDALTPVLNRLGHRGPDFQQKWQDDGIILGHTRLSILDLSESGNQPMIDPATGNAIVVNGEIYNFQELRAGLEARGHSFKSTGDTEVLLKLYGEHGEKCLSMLRGMFAFAIWDKARQLFIARDRLGKKPFFYAQTQAGFIFASEVRALKAHPEISSDIDPEAMDLFLGTGCVPAPWSIYKQIRKLPPAHCGTVDANGLSLRQYWNIDYRDTIECSEGEALDGLLSRLTEAVRLRLISDVPLGALLSGGVDSSLVVALMANMSSEPVKAFSMGFRERKYDETGHASRVAAHLGVQHHVEILEPAGLEEMLPDVIRQYGEPFADDSSLASLLLSKTTRQHVKVALNGDGGDELACGYTSYTHAGTACFLSRFLNPGPMSKNSVQSAFYDSSPLGSMRRTLIFRHLRPELKHLLRGEHEAWQYKKRLYSDETMHLLQGTAFDWHFKLAIGSYAHADNPVERLLWMDNVHSLADMLLVKMDIASMAHGLEVRSPLLDQELVEYMARLPYKLKIKNGEPKYLLKKLAERFLPKDILYRRKQGFSMPVAEWMKGPASTFAKESFSQATPFLEQFFNMTELNQIVDEHIQGRKNHKNMVWNLLNLSLWAIGQD